MIPELTPDERERRRRLEALQRMISAPSDATSISRRMPPRQPIPTISSLPSGTPMPEETEDPSLLDRALSIGRTVLDFTPVGDVMAGGRAGRDVARGNFGSAAFELASTLPFIGMAGDAMRNAKKAKSAGQALEALAGPSRRIAASNLTDESVAKVFEGLTPEEAMQAAIEGRHLRQNPNTGQYIGAPRGMSSPAMLGANRRRVDQKVADGLFNASWYDRARDAINRVSGYDPATMAPDSPEGLRARLLARGGGAYSPQASPKKETNDFMKQYIGLTVSGTPVKPAMQVQADNVARGMRIDPFTGRVELTPNEIRLGEKTGPYADAKDPTIPDENLYDTANDLWHGRVMGYVGNKTDPEGLFDRGFTAAEHGWMTGENLLMARRAQERGLRPPGMESFTWTPRRVQAATWGAERRAQALAEEASKEAEYLKKLRAYDRAQASGRRGVPRPTPPTKMTPEELEAYSRYGVDDALGELTAQITPEFAPGGGTGFLTGFDRLPESLRNDFSRQSLEASGPLTAHGRYNPVLGALGQYQEPIQMVRGEWVDDVTGALESNLSDVARPVVGTDASILSPATATREAKKGGQELSPASRAMMEFTAGIEGVTRGQQGVGMRFFTPANSSFTAAEKTGARIAGSPEELSKAKKALQEAGLDVLDDGDGLLVGRFASEGQTWNTGVDGIQMQRQIRDALAKGTTNIEITPGRLEIGLERMPWGAEGSGQVAQYLDRQLSRPDVVAGAQRLDEGGLPSVLDARYRVAEELGQQQGLPIRADVQKLMDLLRQPNGFRKFQEYVRQNGYAGLPAMALMLGGAGLASQGLPSAGSPSPYQARRDEY